MFWDIKPLYMVDLPLYIASVENMLSAIDINCNRDSTAHFLTVPGTVKPPTRRSVISALPHTFNKKPVLPTHDNTAIA